MERKIREMVALGASYALNCRPCMEFHKKLAAEAGLTREEMLSAIRIADMVRGGAGRKSMLRMTVKPPFSGI
jgi:AhpD family alkylhydroperoxidase